MKRLMMKSLFILIIAFGFESAFAETLLTPELTYAKQGKNSVKMILDIDTGIDDGLALAYALGSPEIELLGIVGSYGNVTTELGVQNALNLLQLLGHPDIPVYAGSQHSLSATEEFHTLPISQFIHGKNGIGEIQIPQSDRKPQQKDGVDFLLESADKYGKDLVVVAVGPLTNIARAMEKDSTFAAKIGKVVIMGGALTLPGNVGQLAEANIIQDPVAANIVFTSPVKLTMVGLDVTMRTIFTKKDTEEWRKLETPSAKAYADMVDYYINSYATTQPDLNGCALHDPLAVAVAIHPELVQTFDMYMKVGVDKNNYGRTIGDKAKLLLPNPNVSVCINVDHNTFDSHFYQVLADLFQK